MDYRQCQIDGNKKQIFKLLTNGFSLSFVHLGLMQEASLRRYNLVTETLPNWCHCPIAIDWLSATSA